MDIANHVAIVTGASSGIGEYTARLLAEKACRVVVNYRENADGAEQAVRSCVEAGAEAIAVKGDVAKDEDCRALAAAAMEKWGRIDALVNNAGITRAAKPGDMDSLSADDFADVFAVNGTLGNKTSVAVSIITLTIDITITNPIDKSLPSFLAAPPRYSITLARLFHLRCVDAHQPDPLTFPLKGIPIDDAGCLGVGLGCDQ